MYILAKSIISTIFLSLGLDGYTHWVWFIHPVVISLLLIIYKVTLLTNQYLSRLKKSSEIDYSTGVNNFKSFKEEFKKLYKKK